MFSFQDVAAIGSYINSVLTKNRDVAIRCFERSCICLGHARPFAGRIPIYFMGTRFQHAAYIESREND